MSEDEDDEFDDVDVVEEGEEDDDFDEEEAADFLRAAEEGNLDGVQIVREKPELQEVQDEVKGPASRKPAPHARSLPRPSTPSSSPLQHQQCCRASLRCAARHLCVLPRTAIYMRS